jgi:chaperonin GroEL
MNSEVPLNILMIKYQTPDNDHTQLHDLATYLGANLVSEKIGSLKGKLSNEHFTEAERVYSFMNKTIFVTADKTNPSLSLLVDEVRKKKESDPEDDMSAKRLASLTSGTVSIEVGASTGPELRELIYRYEDAINATRAAIRSGYVTGGGVTLYKSTRGLGELAEEFGRTSAKQIAHNTGAEFKEDMYRQGKGYNANTGEYSDLAEDGVIEPYDVFKHSIINSFSIAIAILTSGYFIVTKRKENDK